MQGVRLGTLSVVIAGLALVVIGCTAAGGTSNWTYPPKASQASVASPTSAATVAPSVSAPPSATAAGGTPVTLTEWTVTVGGSIKSGKTDLAISNVGAAPHELLIFKSNLEPAAYPTDAAGDIKEEGAGVKLVSDGDNIDPAGSQTRSIDLAPGKYLFVCNIPGHFKQGMFTVVTVAP